MIIAYSFFCSLLFFWNLFSYILMRYICFSTQYLTYIRWLEVKNSHTCYSNGLAHRNWKQKLNNMNEHGDASQPLSKNSKTKNLSDWTSKYSLIVSLYLFVHLFIQSFGLWCWWHIFKYRSFFVFKMIEHSWTRNYCTS